MFVQQISTIVHLHRVTMDFVLIRPMASSVFVILDILELSVKVVSYLDEGYYDFFY